MPDTITRAADTITPSELQFERHIAAPVATVWRYLVEPDLRARWFMGGQTDTRVGGEMEMIFDHGRLSDQPVPTPEKYQAHVGSRWAETITRIDPPHLIAFSWSQGKAGEVTIELSEADGGTRLLLTHKGIRGTPDAQNFGAGWRSHLDVLKTRIEGGSVPNFWELHRRNEADVSAMLGIEAPEGGCRD